MESNPNSVNEESNDQESFEEFPSAEIVYASTIRHYEYERERKQVLETKAGILLTLLLGLITLMISKMKIPEVINLYKTVDFILIIILAGIFVSFLVGIFFAIKVITNEKFSYINYLNFDNSMSTMKKESVYLYLTAETIEALKRNEPINNKKAKYISKIIWSIVVLISFSIINFVVNIFI